MHTHTDTVSNTHIYILVPTARYISVVFQYICTHQQNKKITDLLCVGGREDIIRKKNLKFIMFVWVEGRKDNSTRK